ncbi:MAG: hypothetical protein V4510_10610 [bacterium]
MTELEPGGFVFESVRLDGDFDRRQRMFCFFGRGWAISVHDAIADVL